MVRAFEALRPVINGHLGRVDPSEPESLRDAIALLYETIAALPEQLLQEFEAISEAALDHGLEARAQLVSRGSIKIASSGNPSVILLDAARLLRALEENFIELYPYLASDRDEDLETLWITSNGRHFVSPRTTALAPPEGRAFRRRALRHCRVIPTNIDSFAIRLHSMRSVADAVGAQRLRTERQQRYGAALFPGLTVELHEPGPDLFTVAALGGFDADALIVEQLERARALNCSVVVWGELTMPETSIATVRRHLSFTALEHGCRHHYIVAGSWHRNSQGEMRNVAQILDGRGEPLFEVLKWAKFKIGSKREAIVSGEEVHILIGLGELTVFAICRDFLQETCEVPYRNLAVDVAIVPSMTTAMPDPNTMQGHAATAQTMRIRFGTRTLVVAQPATAGDVDGIGEVLAFPAYPLRSGSEIVRELLHLCILET